VLSVARGVAVVAVVVACLGEVALTNPVAAATAAPSVRADASIGTPVASNNWSGYEQVSKDFSEVQAQWTVPAIPTPVPGVTTGESDWVGIGGSLKSPPLAQIGTGWISVKGGAMGAFAFYEFIDGKTGTKSCCSPVDLTKIDVGAGDKIAAIVIEDSPTSWHFAITDSTSNTSTNFIATSKFAIPPNSAEAVHERQKFDGSFVQLAITPPVTFTHALIFGGPNDYSGPLVTSVSGMTLDSVYMTTDVDNPPTDKTTLAYPLAPTAGGEQFVVKDGHK
jgi:Peptidase A4 family